MKGTMYPTDKCPYWDDEENRDLPCYDGCSHWVFCEELSTDRQAAYICECDGADEEYELVDPEPTMPWE